MSRKRIQQRHDSDNNHPDTWTHSSGTIAHQDRGELLGALKRANDMINDSYQCECGEPKTPCPCLEGFLDNLQAILEQS